MLTTEREERPAHVTFHIATIEDKPASLEAGHYVAKDIHMAHVTPPYSKDMNKHRVDDWFRKLEGDVANGRFKGEWLQRYREQYSAWKNGQELPPEGTPIKGWGIISPAQQETLVRMNIRTVEDLAGANDEGLRRIGMGSVDLRNKARAWLAQIGDKGPITMKMSALERENETLKRSVEALMHQVTALQQASSDLRAPVEAEPAAIKASDIIDQPEDDRAAMFAAYKQKFGKNPHAKISDEMLRARLSE